MAVGPIPTSATGSRTNAPQGPSVQHDVGQLFGHALNALPGYSSLGSNITNPNVNYSGVPNPGAPTPKQSINVPQPAAQLPLQTTDPYAAYGGTAAYNGLVSGANVQHQGILGSIPGAISAQYDPLHSSILDLLDTYKATQTNIDRQAVQNELAKKQGTASVLDAVGHGIKSGGVVLANKNASNSSAGDALAQAYADIGRRQLSGVGNQFEQGKDNINNAQIDLGTAEGQGARKLQEGKTTAVNSIVSDAGTKLSALDAQIASANLPDRINLESEKESIRQQALAQLQQLDQILSQGVANITPASEDTNRAKASELATAGTAPDNSFNFSTDMPAQFQNTGPFASDLPIFTFPGAKKQTA